MNWENFDRLVRYIETLNPKEFNYGKNDFNRFDDRCGCLAFHVRFRLRQSTPGYHDLGLAGFGDLRGALGVTSDEAGYLFGGSGAMWLDGPIESSAPRVWHLTGRAGIDEALRRLRVVAARYARPEPQPFAVDEAAFLRSVRELARETVAGG